jgi:hypothetical protein
MFSFDPVFYQVEIINKNNSIIVALDKEDLMTEQGIFNTLIFRIFTRFIRIKRILHDEWS